jgi:hypothetical protein
MQMVGGNTFGAGGCAKSFPLLRRTRPEIYFRHKCGRAEKLHGH